MAYRIAKNPRAWWPVRWNGVSEDGVVVVNTIEMRFRRLKVDAAIEYIREVEALRPIPSDAEAADQDDPAGRKMVRLYAEAVARVADDWRGVEAENGEPLRWDVPDGWRDDRDEAGKRKPLVAPNLVLLLNEPGLFAAIFDAFKGCMAGEADIRKGN